MTIVDADGRLFGRWNLIDVAVVVLVLAIGPLGYAAFLLFRSPAPKVIALEPAEVLAGPNRRVTVRGENLRPYLRISFDNQQGRTFLFQDSTRAEVDLNEMAPGTYDVVLYDFGQERQRLPKAFTVKPNSSIVPTQDVVVIGRFIGLTAEEAKQIQVGMQLPFDGSVIEVAPARPSIPKVYFGGVPFDAPNPDKREVPAAMKLSCFIKMSGGLPECGRADFTLRPLHILNIPTSGTGGISFQIDQTRSIEPVKEIRVRAEFYGSPEAMAMAAVGDSEIEPKWNPFSLGARIASIEPVVPAAPRRGVTLIIRAQQTPTGWWNGAMPVRVGGQILFVSERYSLTLAVQSIDAP
jgi:hypothetical protein